MKLRRSAPDRTARNTGAPWNRWIVLSAILVLLGGVRLLDLRIPEHSNYGGKYLPPSALTGIRLPDKTAFISINRLGDIRVSNGEEMALPLADPNELFEAVGHIVAELPDRPFVLMVDREISYDRVNLALAAMQQAGVKTVYFHNELPDQSLAVSSNDALKRTRPHTGSP